MKFPSRVLWVCLTDTAHPYLYTFSQIRGKSFLKILGKFSEHVCQAFDRLDNKKIHLPGVRAIPENIHYLPKLIGHYEINS